MKADWWKLGVVMIDGSYPVQAASLDRSLFAVAAARQVGAGHPAPHHAGVLMAGVPAGQRRRLGRDPGHQAVPAGGLRPGRSRHRPELSASMARLGLKVVISKP